MAWNSLTLAGAASDPGAPCTSTCSIGYAAYTHAAWPSPKIHGSEKRPAIQTQLRVVIMPCRRNALLLLGMRRSLRKYSHLSNANSDVQIRTNANANIKIN